MTVAFHFQPYRLFEYERELARREIAGLGMRVVEEFPDRILADGVPPLERLARLTYFSEVRVDDARYVPDIVVLEGRHREQRGDAVGAHQATRYLVHGLHEYKGKFHPQLVRTFANQLGLEARDLVLDPFCGSGTTLVEALLLECDTAGFDLSPIAALIARAKIAVLQSSDHQKLLDGLLRWAASTHEAISRHADAEEPAISIPGISTSAAGYLRRWFDRSAYRDLAAALTEWRRIRNATDLSCVVAVVISSVLRLASLQAPEDLRIRKRAAESQPSPLPHLLEEAVAKAALVIAEAASHGRVRGIASVVTGDVTQVGAVAEARGGSKRAGVVTSPPYATALPYIDTDRLSIVALGLAEPAQLGPLEQELIGSREWRRSIEVLWNEALETNARGLPRSVVSTCLAIRERQDGTAGFRSRAVPGLLYRYFAQMADAMTEIRRALRSGEGSVVVVGVNRTKVRGETFVINTPTLLSDVSESSGFAVADLVPLDTWPRYGMHRDNGVQGEAAIVLSAL